jgi:hypothetical protein
VLCHADDADDVCSDGHDDNDNDDDYDGDAYCTVLYDDGDEDESPEGLYSDLARIAELLARRPTASL